MVSHGKRGRYYQNMGPQVCTWCSLMSTCLKMSSPFRNSHLHRTYDNGAPGKPCFVIFLGPIVNPWRVFGVNDVCVHPNQGELISCDQAGSIKQWDLSENICSHELVSFLGDAFFFFLMLHLGHARHLQAMFLFDRSALPPMGHV
jgi:hypothetical protein